MKRFKNTLVVHDDSIGKDNALSQAVGLVREHPEKAKTQLGERETIDLLVMGTVARTGIPRIIAGNAVETVLRMVKCGMLAVKPDGFQTPVLLPKPTETVRSAQIEESYEPAHRLA